MKKSIIVLAMGIFTMACGQQQMNTAQHVEHVKPADFKIKCESAQGIILDVRTPDEYKQGHIKGAVLIDFYSNTFTNEINQLDKSKAIYVYCRSGNRSGKAVSILKESGFQEIINLQSGIISWINEGLPIEK